MGVAVVALNSLEAADEVLEARISRHPRDSRGSEWAIHQESLHRSLSPHRGLESLRAFIILGFKGEAGTDKACVQGLGGGTGSCSASHAGGFRDGVRSETEAKTAELPYEAGRRKVLFDMASKSRFQKE